MSDYDENESISYWHNRAKRAEEDLQIALARIEALESAPNLPYRAGELDPKDP